MPEIEYVTLAAHAEAINGLLYLQGAGLTDIVQPNDNNGQPGVVHVGIGVSIVVGWNETGQSFPITISVVDEDGSPLINAGGQIEAGRPPNLPAGSVVRSVLALSAEVQFPRGGGYEVRAELGGATKAVAFRVHQQAQPPSPPTQAGPTTWPTPRAD
ncbi:MAG TPA: hypothetical protein VF288_08810 [Mycobacteriales bacterium]